MTREEVYKLIDTERLYQDTRWNITTTPTGGLHSPTEWLVYIQDYLTEAMHSTSRSADPEAKNRVLDGVRKIAAMCVICMEQHGAPSR
jgi:hypothetical protein